MPSEKVKLNKVRPHGPLVKVFENIWFVQGQVKMPMAFPPMKISKSMTIIRNPKNNELTLINAMPLNNRTLEELSRLGQIKNTLRVGGFHGKDDAFYKQKYGATVYALKGHHYERNFEKVPGQPENSYMSADIYLDEKSELPIPEASIYFFKVGNPIEGILHIKREGGILVTADSLQNTPAPDQFVNLPAKIMMKKMGFYSPYAIGPGWVQFAKPSIEEIRSILQWNFEHVLPGHGKAVIGQAKEKYRPSLEGEIKGCH